MRLPTFLRQYGKMATRCAAEWVGHPQYLLQLSELEFIYGHQRMMQRRIAVTDGTAVKGGRLDRPSNIRWRVSAEPGLQR